MYWNKQTRNKPEAKKRGFYILIILWFWFLPRIAAIQWNPASTQVLQKCASQSNDLPASGSNPSNTRRACLRQRTSAHPCFADANPLYLESSPSSQTELSLRGTWGHLCSQVCPWGGCEDTSALRCCHTCPGCAQLCRTRIRQSWHSDPLKGRARTWGQSCQLKLQELSLALKSTESQSRTPAGLCFLIQYISQRCNQLQADSSTTQRASLATLQRPCAFLIGICPLFVFADSPRGAYNDAHEDRWGFLSTLSSAGTTVPLSWRNCALMPPAANKHGLKVLPWTHWAKPLLLQSKKK